MNKPYSGKLSIKERLQEESPSLNRIFQDIEDSLKEIIKLEQELRIINSLHYC